MGNWIEEEGRYSNISLLTLLSDKASMVHGSKLPLDGGLLEWVIDYRKKHSYNRRFVLVPFSLDMLDMFHTNILLTVKQCLRQRVSSDINSEKSRKIYQVC